jgi:hypothetical protein
LQNHIADTGKCSLQSHEKVLNARSVSLLNAYMDYPEWFVKGVPSIEQVPQEVWINKPIDNDMVELGVS